MKITASTARGPASATVRAKWRIAGLLLFSTALLGIASAQTAKPTKPAKPTAKAMNATYTGAVRPYDIPLLGDGLAFSQPSNQWSYFFELRPGIKLVGTQYVEINFVCSPLLKGAEGSMTIFLNGSPVQSRKIGEGVNMQGLWHVELPLRQFKVGFNELKIVSRQRTSDGPCKDLDNSSNWIKFGPGCRMHLVRADPLMFPLYTYPEPFLDPLVAKNPVQSIWVLPDGAKQSQVGEALGLASDWGRSDILSGLKIRLVRGGTRPGHNILVGGSEEGALADKEGMLAVTPGGKAGNSRLTISGAGDTGLRSARRALGFPEMVAQIQGYKAKIEVDPAEERRLPTTRLGTFTFNDLKVPHITMSGAFHQHATLTVQRPVRCDLGRASKITVHFTHSATLNPHRSILSLFINSIPVGSARLDDENANNGSFTATIPVSELAKNVWQLDFEAYHDLAAVDCSKSYDEVAWTVVDGESTFELNQGPLGGRPYLDAFPYLVDRDGNSPTKVAISLSQTPSDAELSAAAVIAARAAQVNRYKFDWDVQFNTLPTSKDSAIIIGTYDETSRFSAIEKNLLVAPTGNGSFRVDPNLRIVKEGLVGGAVLQAIPSPNSDSGVTYVLLGANDAALQRFTAILADSKHAQDLTGQVVVMRSDGQLTTLSTVGDRQVTEQRSTATDNYSPTMRWIMGGIIVFLILICIWAYNQFRKR